MAELTLEQKRAVAIATARLRLKQKAPAEDIEAIKKTQAARFPSSQEQGKGGAGVNAPWYSRAAGAAAENYLTDTAFIHSPIETAKVLPAAIPRMINEFGDFFNPGKQVGRVIRGEPIADPAGVRPIIEPLMRGDIPEAGGALVGKGAAALSMAGLGHAATRAPLVPVKPTPESLMMRAGNLRQMAAGGGPFRGSVVDDFVSYKAGQRVGGQTGGLITEALNLVRQMPAARNMRASLYEFIANRMAGKQATSALAIPDEAIARVAPESPIIPPGMRQEFSLPPRGPENRAPVFTPDNPPEVMHRIPGAQKPAIARPQPSRVYYDSAGNRIDIDDPATHGPRPEPAPAMTAAQINKWMNVRENQLLYGKNPGKRILEENLVGANKAETLSNVAVARKAAGEAMDEVFKRAEADGVRFDLDGDIQSAIADAKKTIGKSSDEAFMKAIEGVENDIISRTDDLKSMTPSQAHELEVELGRGVNWTGASSDVQRLLKDIRKRINVKLKTVQGIIPLKERWGDLFEGEKALKSSIRKDEIGRGTGSILPPSVKR